MYRDEFRCLYPLPGVLGGILTEGNQLSVVSSWIKYALITITRVYSYMNKDLTHIIVIIFILICIHEGYRLPDKGESQKDMQGSVYFHPAIHKNLEHAIAVNVQDCHI